MQNITKLASKSVWNTVIGLEVHAQLASKSKLFSGGGTQFETATNAQVAIFDAALPGSLPVLNKRCVELAVKTALALNCQVNPISEFDRKHYFYADLPAGYQITQYRKAIANNGILNYVWLDDEKQLRKGSAPIVQIQLEQDSGKSIHDDIKNRSLIDLNRAGIGLIEIITEPCFTSSLQAVGFIEELRRVLLTVGSCSCNMWEGALRVDANVSVNLPGEPLGVRSEVKNLNSLRSVNKAIDYEINRHTNKLKNGEKIVNETRSFDTAKEITLPMRDKEEVQDYRFLPEVNLPPLRLHEGCGAGPCTGCPPLKQVCIQCLHQQIPQDLLPSCQRVFLEQVNVNYERASVLLNNPDIYHLYRQILHCSGYDFQLDNGKEYAREAAFWVTSQIFALSRQNGIPINELPLSPRVLSEFVNISHSKLATPSQCRKLLDHLYTNPNVDPVVALKENNWCRITDYNLVHSICATELDDMKNSRAMTSYKKGKAKGFKQIVKKIYDKHPNILEEDINKAVTDILILNV